MSLLCANCDHEDTTHGLDECDAFGSDVFGDPICLCEGFVTL